MIQTLIGARAWALEHLVAPAFFALGLMDRLEDAEAWVDFIALGLLQVALTWAVCRPLEALDPVEPVTDRASVRTDVTYTLLNRIGILPLLMFVVFQPLGIAWEGLLADMGVVPPTIESFLPWLSAHPFVALLVYIVVLDFADYWRHRLQHSLDWWWALHSLHHAQRQMTFWTDDRNHLIDDMLTAAWLAGWAVLIGVPPGQFPLVLLVLRLAESFSHANVRASFGRLVGRLLVSPHFHRVHHALDHAAAPHDRTHGCNFAVLFPVWDMLFGTARFGGPYPATGDLSGSERLARGSWLSTQAEGAKRLLRTLAGRG